VVVAVKVLVVDDESHVRESIARALRYEGYAVDLAPDGVEALNLVRQDPPDLVILDLQMPRMDGLDMCRRLRAAGDSMPILVLTARSHVSDRVNGLDAGADDYLVKPFALDELLARLRALARRAQPDDVAAALRVADLVLDPAARRAVRAGVEIVLTRLEFDLLELLMRHHGQVLTRPQIVDSVWDLGTTSASNALDVHVAHLRRKTEAVTPERLIHTVRGVGYVLRAQ